MSYKVLIIDDDPAIRNYYTELVESSGYATLTAEDGESGIEKYKEEKPDLVLLDINMPGKNGLETLKEIKDIDENQKVFLLTSEVQHKRNFISLYADEFIPKAKKPEILLSRIKLHIEEMK